MYQFFGLGVLDVTFLSEKLTKEKHAWQPEDQVCLYLLWILTKVVDPKYCRNNYLRFWSIKAVEELSVTYWRGLFIMYETVKIADRYPELIATEEIQDRFLDDLAERPDSLVYTRKQNKHTKPGLLRGPVSPFPFV